MKKKTLHIILWAVIVLVTITGCSSKNEESQAAHKQAGIDAMSAGEYSQAIENFNAALALADASVDEGEIDICYYKAAAQSLAGDFKGAIATYAALIAYDDKNPYPLYLRGSAYANENDYDHALEDYKAAVACDEENYELYIQIFQNLNALGHRDEGLEFLNMALEIDGNKAENDMQRGRIYLILEQYDAAKKALNKAIDKNLDEAKVYMAQTCMNQGSPQEAEEILTDYMEHDKVTSEALNMIGCMKMEQQDYASALDYFQKGLGLEAVTNRKDLMKNEIAAMERTGDFVGAKKKVKAFLREYPGDEEALREQAFLATR